MPKNKGKKSQKSKPHEGESGSKASQSSSSSQPQDPGKQQKEDKGKVKQKGPPSQPQVPQEQKGSWSQIVQPGPSYSQVPQEQKGPWGQIVQPGPPFYSEVPQEQKGPWGQTVQPGPSYSQVPQEQQGPWGQIVQPGPSYSQVPQEQRGPWRHRPGPPYYSEAPQEQEGIRDRTPQTTSPTQPETPKKQKGIRGRTPQAVSATQYQAPQEQKGRWSQIVQPGPSYSQVPQEQQGPWGQIVQPGPSYSQVPQEQKGPWRHRPGPPYYSEAPQEQEGIRDRTPQTTSPTQPETPKKQKEFRGRTPQAVSATQHQAPQEQKGPWGQISQPGPSHAQVPQEQQGVRGKAPHAISPTQLQAPKKQKGIGSITARPDPFSQPPVPKEHLAEKMSSLSIIPRSDRNSIVVAANYFPVTMKNMNIPFIHYDVTFEPDKPKFLLRQAWSQFCAELLNNRITVFDGRKNAFSKGKLIKEKEYSAKITVLNRESRRSKEFVISIKEVRQIDMSDFQKEKYGSVVVKELKEGNIPEAKVSFLEIILKNNASLNLIGNRRSFFFQKKSFLSDLFELRHGFTQSISLGSKIYLNFDLSSKPFYRENWLLDIAKNFERYGNYDLENFNSFLKNVKIEYELPNDPASQKIYRVNKLVRSAEETTFKKENGEVWNVAQYFAVEKKIHLRFPRHPLLWVGSKQKSIFLPMEFCKIVKDQIYYDELDRRDKSKMINETTLNARIRRKTLEEVFEEVNFDEDVFLKEFGITISKEMEKVGAHVLTPPTLQSPENIFVRRGKWDSRNFLEPKSFKQWCIICLCKMATKDDLEKLQSMIKTVGNELKMNIGNPIKGPIYVKGDDFTLRKILSQHNSMDIIFVVIPTNSRTDYSKVKTISETEEGILTQCIKSGTLRQNSSALYTTIKNLLMKVNAKLGGVNHCLTQDSTPSCLKGEVMVIGADVTHSSPGSKMPSVAAVAVSCDPKAFKYGVTTRIQIGEMIQDLEEIIKIHLDKFVHLRKRYPEKILFFRDGVSDGEMEKVLREEVRAVKRACENLCDPKLTFVVVQKRHHTRFYPTSQRDEADNNFNVPVGTCVDNIIVSPRNYNFILVSHVSIRGTVRPTKYCVLYNENKIDAKELQNLTYYLCHLYSRCNRSVSYPSPTYNAHLAAFRGAVYLKSMKTEKADFIETQNQITDKISAKSPMFYV